MSAESKVSSERDVQVAREAAMAFGRAFTEGDHDGFLQLLADDIGFEVPSVMQHTVKKLHGRGEIRAYLEETTSEYHRVDVAPREIRDLGGGRFLMSGWWRAEPRHSVTPFGTPVAVVLDIHDGRVSLLRAFFDEALAIDASRRD